MLSLFLAMCAPAMADPWGTGAGASTGDVFVSGPAGAQLLLDGAPTGLTAPATLKQVPVGVHQVGVRQGCMVADQRVEVHAQAIERVDPVLSLGAATLTVGVNVDGAAVTLDGQPLGTSPLTTQTIPCGAHELGATLDGYSRAQSSVQTHAGEVLTVSLELVRAQVGNIAVDVTPVEAEVLLDGKAQGTGPRTLSSVPAGSHTIVARARGYVDGTMPVALGVDETARVSLSLTKQAPFAQRAGLTTVPWGKVALGAGLTIVAGGGAGGAVLTNRAATQNYATYSELTYLDAPDEYYAKSVATPRALTWVSIVGGSLAAVGAGFVWLDVGGVHLFSTGNGVAGTF